MTIWLGRDAAANILEQATAFAPLETGGILLGWRDGPDRIVVDIVGPGPRAMHGRHAFIPDHAFHLDMIAQAFSSTNGDLDYLGDWHTHPDGVAAMSAADDRTLALIARKVHTPLMLIAAGGGDDWTIAAWTATRRRLWRALRIEDRDVRLFDAPPRWPRARFGERATRADA